MFLSRYSCICWCLVLGLMPELVTAFSSLTLSQSRGSLWPTQSLLMSNLNSPSRRSTLHHVLQFPQPQSTSDNESRNRSFPMFSSQRDGIVGQNNNCCLFKVKSNHQLAMSSTPGDNQSSSSSSKSNQLDVILSRLTSAFPFFVLGSAILGLLQPATLMWTNRGTLISWMLASVMCATGLTLEKKDFTKVLGQDLAAVPAGVLCQFIIMPLSAFLVGTKLLLQDSNPYGASLFLGLVLVGCSPGGTASNLVSLIAKADVALSVLLTSCSTILASVVTPLLVKLLVGSTIQVSGWALCEATARVVLFPVMFGMLVNAKFPNLASRVSRFTPFASVILVSLICGGVVAQNATMFLQSSALIPRIVGSVLALHGLGFLVGYLVPKWGLGFSEMTSRTISIETGMQNSALAVVLARSIGAPPVASLPGAISATVHSCLGSILAGYWHSRQGILTENGKGVPSFNPLPEEETDGN